MLKANLTQRFMLVTFAIIAAIILALYVYSVPLIKSKVFEIERNASRIALNNVFELADKMHAGTEEYREQILESHRQRLRTVVDSAAFLFAQQMALASKAGMNPQQARRYVLNQLRELRYGDGNYLWVADESFHLISHPDPAYHGHSAQELLDEQGRAVLPPVVETAIAEGEGFYSYRWHRLDNSTPLEKFSYVRYFPQWRFVIGSGVYIDDIEAEVAARRERALRELRNAFAEIKIANTGYLFIFDSQGRMLAHPNRNIDGFDFRALKNPMTGNPIMQDLISVADTGRELSYKWDRPTDPGHYLYDKISLVRYLPGFDWYICSSIYLAELQASSQMLADRILVIAFVSLLAASLLALVFVSYITRPIRQLSETASRISSGELAATTNIQRDDEIGVLARSFDLMVYRLRRNIAQLDDKVSARTLELQQRNRQLNQAMEEIRATSYDLKLLEERQRLILDALPAQIAYIDNDQRYVFVNQGYADAFRRSKAALIGRHLREVVGEQMYSDIQRQVESALGGITSTFEYPLQQDDRVRITKRTLMPFAPEAGRVVGLINLSLDITAERENERRLEAAQRMHTVGQLAGGLAHDFNNLLSILQGNLLAMQENPAAGSLRRHIEPAIRATRRGADITRRLLAFARRQPLSPRPVDLSALMDDCGTLIKGSLPASITQEIRLDEALWQPLVDPGQLEDALVNLALNARTAMPDGGQLSFRLSNRRVTTVLFLDEQVEPGDYVEVNVCDTGYGFSQEAIKRAFEPFFTTSKGDNASGLGLSMVYGFVKQSAGYIALSNNAAGGACVTLLLPANRTPEQAEVGTSSAPSDCDCGLVLLVDDEDDLRQVVLDQLIRLGYQVIECRNGQEAADLIDNLPRLDALVSDIVMPGELSGYDLARRLRARQPDAAVVLISGFALRRQEQPGDCGVFPLLHKPFTREQLGRAIRSRQAHGPLLEQQGR